MGNNKILTGLVILGIVLLGLVFFTRSNSDNATQQSVISNSDFSYTHKFDSEPFAIGDLSFSSSELYYDSNTCPRHTPKARVGQPRDDCWKVNITFGNQKFSMTHNEEVQLNPYLNVKLKASGTVRWEVTDDTRLEGEFRRDSDWTNEFIFMFTDEPFLFYDFKEDNTLVALGAGKNIPIEVENKFTGFEGGFRIISFSDKFFIGTELAQTDTKLEKGTQVYYIPLRTDRLGQRVVRVRPFIEVGSKKFYTEEDIEMTYNIVPNIDTTIDTSTTCLEDTDCPSGFLCQSYLHNNQFLNLCENEEDVVRVDKINETIDKLQKIVIVSLIIVIIIGLFVTFKRLKGGR